MVNDGKKGITAKITYPEVTEEDKFFYSNAISINHTPWDFAMHFAYVVMPQIPQPSSAGKLEIKAKRVAVVNIPATLVRGLIRALETNLERYEGVYGKIEMPKEEGKK
jgi:hypothetical protein